MDKEEILSKSRAENKNEDLHALEVQGRAAAAGGFAALVLATIFFVVQILLGEGLVYGLYSIVFSVGAASFIVNSISFKRKKDIILSVTYTAATLLFAVLHISQLISNSSVL